MKDHKEFLLEVAAQAGELIRSNFVLGMTKEMKAGDRSPLTGTDLKINQLVLDEAARHYPDYGVIAEEGSRHNEKDEYVWVCDPIDGTIPFSHGLAISTFTMALVHNGQPIMGVILDPYQKRTFFAEKDKGAFLNNKPIAVTERNGLEGSMMYAERWHQALYRIVPMIEALEKENCHLSVIKSTANTAALVAAGEAIGLLFPGKTPWDMAAAKIIVEEAGGRVTDFEGNEQRYDRDILGCLVTNGVMHDKLLSMVKEYVTKN